MIGLDIRHQVIDSNFLNSIKNLDRIILKVKPDRYKKYTIRLPLFDSMSYQQGINIDKNYPLLIEQFLDDVYGKQQYVILVIWSTRLETNLKIPSITDQIKFTGIFYIKY